MALDLSRLSPSEKQEAVTLLSRFAWWPHPDNKPQVRGYFSDATEILYGGSAGGGKSDLILGKARTNHKRSLLLRRTFPDLDRSLISRSLEFFGPREKYNSSRHVWEIDGRRIEFGHLEHIGTPTVPGDESQYASAPYDLICFDQLEQFPEYPYLFMFSRLRSAKGIKTQIISTANPIGKNIEWIMNRWRPWLVDKTAKAGEIIYYKRLPNGTEVKTDASDPDGVSRTYIPAGLKDNPYLGDDYRRMLNLLPEPLRSALLNGDWSAMLTDDAYQLFPRAWVKAAMERWTETPPESERHKPPVIGSDIARGGDDQTVNAIKRGAWFDRLHKHAGRDTPNGESVVGLWIPLVANGGTINADVIGVGASAYDIARMKGLPVTPVNFASHSDATDKSGTLFFANKRAELYWRFKEMLDPDSGMDIALPPDPELLGDLCAVHWEPRLRITIQDKDEIKKVLGRSPDSADAVILACAPSGMSDDELFRYGRGQVVGDDVTDDMLDYVADTYGITREQAREMLRKQMMT